MRPVWVLWWMDSFFLQTSAKGVSVVSLWYLLQLPGACYISVKFTCFSSLSLPTRCDSWSNSERSLEQTSSDDVFVDCLQQLPSSNLVYPSPHGNGSQEVPSTRPQAALIWNRDINGPSRNHFSSSRLETSLNSTIQVDKNQGSLPYRAKELDIISITPPPRPPKPIHLSERRQEEHFPWSGHSSIKKPEYTVAPRRISLSGLDTMRTWKGKCWMLMFRYREKPDSS